MRHLQAARGTPLNRRLLALLAAGVVLLGLGADQASKGAVLGALTSGRPVEVVGILLRFNLTFSPGAVPNLGTLMTLALGIFTIAVLLACAFVALRRVRTFPQGLTVGLFMAGISGNLHDRLLRAPGPLLGHVVSFIQLPHFATFNVVDICITSAVALVVLPSLRNPPSDGKGSERVRAFPRCRTFWRASEST